MIPSYLETIPGQRRTFVAVRGPLACWRRDVVIDPLTPLVGGSRDLAVQNSEPMEAELERGILEAVRLGLADVARTLSPRGSIRGRPTR